MFGFIKKMEREVLKINHPKLGILDDTFYSKEFLSHNEILKIISKIEVEPLFTRVLLQSHGRLGYIKGPYVYNRKIGEKEYIKLFIAFRMGGLSGIQLFVDTVNPITEEYYSKTSIRRIKEMTRPIRKVFKKYLLKV